MAQSDYSMTFRERYAYQLRELYQRFGYTLYRMGKFEEYDLYARNKDFLISDAVITFTDVDGKLMALKPDVTLSIIKNNRALSGRTEKLCYNENVYRVSKGTNSFKEIMQAGIECIGDIDSYSIGECLYLAAASLSLCEKAERFVLSVSSLDILLAFISKLTDDSDIHSDIIRCVGEKNTHEIIDICRKNGIDASLYTPLTELVSTYGKASSVIASVERLCRKIGEDEKARAFKEALSVFDGSDYADCVHIDFSVISDHNYYNGIVFKGYIPSVPGAVLSGGQYDRLMRKMHRSSRAVGFAVYLDLLDGDERSDCDVDILLLYDETVAPSMLRAGMEKLSQNGESVRALKADDPKLKYHKKLRIDSTGEIR